MAKDKKRRLTKNEKRRLRRKQKRKELQDGTTLTDVQRVKSSQIVQTNGALEFQPVEYTMQTTKEIIEEDAAAKEFESVFRKFNGESTEIEEPTGSSEDKAAIISRQEAEIREKILEEERRMKEMAEKAEQEKLKKNQLSRKQRKRQNEEKVSELKKIVDRPDLVESQDMNSSDPEFLIYLKGIRNSVPIPRHWADKYRYLGHKRSLEQSRYTIPDFLVDAGVRVSQRTHNPLAGKTAKQIARERIRPRLGKIDVDYQSLHDAFFKHQKKFYLPKLRERLKIHNQLYYENEEFQGIFRHKRLDRKNNKLSNKLKLALGMTSTLMPPPWLKNMQRYGPPPSYPGLKIPGLNAPIPQGASFGDHVNGWGRPPVDLHGRPLYGMQVYSREEDEEEKANEERIEHWGEPESDEEYESDSEEEMEIEEDDEEVRETAPVAEEQVETEDKKEETEIVPDNTLAVDRQLELRKASQDQLKSSHSDGEKTLFKVIEKKQTTVEDDTVNVNTFKYELGKTEAIVEKEVAKEDSESEEEDFKF